MTASLTTIVVLVANSLTSVIAATLLMLVLWQAPRQRANQLFALTMLSLGSYTAINSFARFVDELTTDPAPVFYLAATIYGLFVVSVFFFASEFAAGLTRVMRWMRGIGLALVAVYGVGLWTGNVTTNIHMVPGDDRGYAWDLTTLGSFASATLVAYLVASAIVLRQSRDERARSLWLAPVLATISAIGAIVLWPLTNIPVNAIFLAVTAVALGMPVLRRELFSPLANAHAELARKNEELERVNRTKSQFLATVSHELRTPLNSINGYTEMAINGEYGPLNDVQRDRLEKVLRNGRQLLNLINDVLDLNQIEHGEMRLDQQSIDLPALLDTVLDTCEPLATQKGLAVVRDFADAPAVCGDEVRIREIVTNIFSNACKFTQAGSVVVRARSAADGMVRLEIADTGVGISPEQYDVVFAEFHQVGGQAHSYGDGTGLGMAITKRLVELHGGVIWLDSAPGEGTTVYVTLPAARCDGASG